MRPPTVCMQTAAGQQTKVRRSPTARGGSSSTSTIWSPAYPPRQLLATRHRRRHWFKPKGGRGGAKRLQPAQTRTHPTQERQDPRRNPAQRVRPTAIEGNRLPASGRHRVRLQPATQTRCERDAVTDCLRTATEAARRQGDQVPLCSAGLFGVLRGAGQRQQHGLALQPARFGAVSWSASASPEAQGDARSTDLSAPPSRCENLLWSPAPSHPSLIPSRSKTLRARRWANRLRRSESPSSTAKAENRSDRSSRRGSRWHLASRIFGAPPLMAAPPRLTTHLNLSTPLPQDRQQQAKALDLWRDPSEICKPHRISGPQRRATDLAAIHEQRTTSDSKSRTQPTENKR